MRKRTLEIIIEKLIIDRNSLVEIQDKTIGLKIDFAAEDLGRAIRAIDESIKAVEDEMQEINERTNP